MAKPFLSTTKFEVSINKAALIDAVTVGPNGKITGRQVRSYILPIIEETQRELIKDFHSHPITKEIKSGPNSSNSSGTLGGYGNLFSFIGFERGENPTKVIESIISERLVVRVRAISNAKFRISILNAPSKEDIYNATPIPWANGSSWAEGMEKGISNLGSFLYRGRGAGSSSRSGTGLQIKNTLRATNFRTEPYISKLMDKFLKNVIKF